MQVERRRANSSLLFIPRHRTRLKVPEPSPVVALRLIRDTRAYEALVACNHAKSGKEFEELSARPRNLTLSKKTGAGRRVLNSFSS